MTRPFTTHPQVWGAGVLLAADEQEGRGVGPADPAQGPGVYGNFDIIMTHHYGAIGGGVVGGGVVVVCVCVGGI